MLLELKLIADVGLIGFPNVGKSTLLSMISKSRPKIANYHFTTLTPNLGVVFVDAGQSFVCADIPGLIEGASEGVGLGHYFLRHVERCRLLVHLVDVSGSEGRDPVDDMMIINRELEKYSPELAKRPQIIVCNKTDILEADSDNLDRVKVAAEQMGFMCLEMSAATNTGTRELIYKVWDELQKLDPIPDFEADFVFEEETLPEERDIQIEVEDGIYYIRGTWIEKVVGSTNFGDYESRMYFERTLRKAGVFDMLEREGIQEKDTVDACGLQFEYIY
ncbi:MAG: Obg family GTPase CgtA [Oscillospiraceae bacterium]|nr:Obg family GTPase CgtA [Oscillospiraceae bacterium]